MSIGIRIGSAMKRALQQVAANMEQTRSGLYLPPEYIAGKHFGGFSGYEDWIQDCVRHCCQMVRGVGPDELPEVAAWAMWQPDGVLATVRKHGEIMRLMEDYAASIPNSSGLMDEARTQIRRVDGTRTTGTLLVIAMNPTRTELTNKLPMSVSAWVPSSVEEAKAVPRQEYQLDANKL